MLYSCVRMAEFFYHSSNGLYVNILRPGHSRPRGRQRRRPRLWSNKKCIKAFIVGRLASAAPRRPPRVGRDAVDSVPIFSGKILSALALNNKALLLKLKFAVKLHWIQLAAQSKECDRTRLRNRMRSFDCACNKKHAISLQISTLKARAPYILPLS